MYLAYVRSKNLLLFEHAIAVAWCRYNEAMSSARPVFNCWTTQPLCFYIGIDTGHSNALHGDVAAGIN